MASGLKAGLEAPLQTEWGAPSLVSATRVMIMEALENPFAQRFQLLCETTIPVRTALFTWHQLLAKNESRVGPPHPVRHRIPALSEFQMAHGAPFWATGPGGTGAPA